MPDSIPPRWELQAHPPRPECRNLDIGRLGRESWVSGSGPSSRHARPHRDVCPGGSRETPRPRPRAPITGRLKAAHSRCPTGTEAGSLDMKGQRTMHSLSSNLAPVLAASVLFLACVGDSFTTPAPAPAPAPTPMPAPPPPPREPAQVAGDWLLVHEPASESVEAETPERRNCRRERRQDDANAYLGFPEGMVSRDTNFYAVGRHLLLRTPGSVSGSRFGSARCEAEGAERSMTLQDDGTMTGTSAERSHWTIGDRTRTVTLGSFPIVATPFEPSN